MWWRLVVTFTLRHGFLNRTHPRIKIAQNLFQPINLTPLPGHYIIKLINGGALVGELNFKVSYAGVSVFAHGGGLHGIGGEVKREYYHCASSPGLFR